MHAADLWLREYSRSHRNPLNRKIHLLCAPTLYWSVFALLWALPKPNFIHTPFLNWSTSALLVVLGFYLWMGTLYFLEMLVMSMVDLFFTITIDNHNWPLGKIAIAVFVFSWAAQLVGHRSETKRPGYFHDLLFILIGPLWFYHQLFAEPPTVTVPKVRESYRPNEDELRRGDPRNRT